MSIGVEMSKQERIEQIQSYLCGKFHLPVEQVGEMLPSFLITLDSHMGKLESAWESGDLSSLGRAGHTIKGALLNLGLHECAEIALRIEEKGKAEDDNADYQEMIKELRHNLASLLE